MALFGTSDEYVPLLTAFYQAEPDKEKPIGSELDVLMFRYTFGLPHDTAFWSKVQTSEAEKQLQKIAGYHGLMVRLMDAVADDHLPDETDLWQFNTLAREILTPPQLFRTGSPLNWAHYPPEKEGAANIVFLSPRFGESRFKQNAVGKAGILVRYPTPASETGGESDTTAFLAEVLTEFIKGFERNAFTRCEECKSVFAATRRGQRFCSQRDASRVAQRRVRQRKAERALTMSH